MKRILIIGAGEVGVTLLKYFINAKQIQIVAVIEQEQNAAGIQFAKNNSIPTDRGWDSWIKETIDLVFIATEAEQFTQLVEAGMNRDKIIPFSICEHIAYIYNQNNKSINDLKLKSSRHTLIMDNIHEGMIVVDVDESVIFVNRRAEEITGIPKEKFLRKPIQSVIETSRLPQVLRSRRKELNQKLTLENGKTIISTRIPILDQFNELKGAFAIFRDISEIVELAEQVSGLNEVKKMLEAIFHSSEEAITVVDEDGKGIMINPAYTRITGLTKEEVIGKPADVDIFEGESMHLKVLQTRRPVRGVRMKVGQVKKDVLVNASPIIVDGKLKGSVGVLHDVSEIQALTSELKRARQIIRNLEAKYTFDDIICTSEEMKIALEQAKVGAKTPATVLLRGESGTGKELFAHAIHNESERRNNKFIRVNCAALSESILESELFGYEEGAFTGARRGGKIGYFEEANHGSIFLDEIGELSLSMQAKLLRVLQENEIVRVGSAKTIQINVRIITATNANLEKAVMNGDFREDLYYRLNRLPIFIPPLRERMEDLEPLINHLIDKVNQDYGRTVKQIDSSAVHYLLQYDWPGNIRELENVISRAMIYMGINEEVIKIEHIPALNSHQEISQNTATKIEADGWNQLSLQATMDAYEQEVILSALQTHNYNKTRTAKALNISIRNLYYKLEKYNIEE